MKVTVLLLAGLVLVAGPAAAQRQRLSMDPGWRFLLGDPAGAQRPDFADRQWRQLDLPHDWSVELAPRQDAPAGGRGGFFPTGVAWYRKHFELPPAARRRRLWLEFDGVYMNSEVWVNGVSVGRRPFGYITFGYDITRHLRSGNNVIAVRVDNSQQPNSRWYSGSGIYRHVWLTVTDPLHVSQWGTWVTTPRADSAGADVAVRTIVANSGGGPRQGILRSLVLDSAGREVARVESPFTVAAGQQAEVEHRVSVPSPVLWSVERPYLYSLRTLVRDDETDHDGRVDQVNTPFGIRRIEWDANRGFLLNGRFVRLNGVNLHHDAGALGAAVPERVWERRLETLKAMGVNAIRTSHNPVAPEFLDLCDRMGFLVMNEVYDEWTQGKVPHGYHNYFAEWSERDVTDFVRRDRNHPSVVLWSAGNEIGEQKMPNGHLVLRRLQDIFHREDPTRPVTTGNDNIVADGGATTQEFLNTVDIVGYNYVDRWHERREIFAEADRLANPGWRMIGTESGSIFQSFDERYSLGDDPNVPRANYTTGMLRVERQWKWMAMRPWFTGDFMWTGIDYLGESTWPFKGFASGALDITGHPKDAFYLYQALWTDRPVMRIFPHWNWPGREGQALPVVVYSSCNTVELFLNGRSLGEKRWEFPAQGTSGGWNTYAQPRIFPTTNDLHLVWDVPYQPGVLRAVGKRRDGTVGCQGEVRTAGAAASIRLRADRDTVTTGLGDVAHVTVDIVDSAGTVVPSADLAIAVSVSGGRVLVVDNANLRDLEAYRSDRGRTFMGRALVIAAAPQAGTLQLTVTAEGLSPASVTVPVRRGSAPASVPATR